MGWILEIVINGTAFNLKNEFFIFYHGYKSTNIYKVAMNETRIS